MTFKPLLLALLAAALLCAAAPATADTPASSSLAGYRYCGKIANPSTGGTVRIFGRRTSCNDSRNLWRIWRRNTLRATCNEANNHCEVTYVHRFRCVYGGTDFEVRLRCTRGTKRVRGFWGG